ncbi:MAG TPA: 50S ribosomal protein L11 methyltransferase [Thermomicrobiales bacterium]|nr:50S ribosomal protein L11 methyltransferase [Thermomicrobiales bacterium]
MSDQPAPHSDSINASTHHPERSWYQLSVDVDSESVEAVSELFGRYGFNQGIAIDEPYVQDGDGDNMHVAFDKPFTIHTYIAEEDFRPEIIEELRHALYFLGQLRGVSDIRISSLKEEDWANAWKEHFQVHKIGERVVIRPPWREYEPKDDEIVIELDPGMAFGTGLHPSTRLSMLGTEEVVKPGDTVLDVGTGSGILAIAAAKIGASKVDTVDVEGVAVRATRENADRNGVGDLIAVEHGSVGVGQPFHGGQYDVVIANIIARVLIELSEAIVAHTWPGGAIVLAGIIDSREQDVIDAYEAQGADVVTRRSQDDWISLVLRRRAS